MNERVERLTADNRVDAGEGVVEKSEYMRGQYAKQRSFKGRNKDGHLDGLIGEGVELKDLRNRGKNANRRSHWGSER